MTDRIQINLAVGEEQKENWTEYADVNHRSLSQLIRFSVEKEIDGGSEHGGGSDELAEHLSELSEGIQKMTGRMDRMNGRLNDLERVVKQDSPEVSELANDVFEVLPTEGEFVTETHESVIPSNEEGGIGHVVSGRVDHIATRLGVSETRVGEALQKLQDDTALVGSKSISGRTRYYKEV